MRSKLNRKRVDVRIPHWFRETIASIEEKYQLTFTEALIRCGEKGAAYYEKQWAAKQKQKSQADAGSGDERCPNESPNKNIPQRKMTEEEKAQQKTMEKYEANIQETIRIAKTPWVPED